MDLLTSVLTASRGIRVGGLQGSEMLGGPKPTKVVTTGGGRNRVGEMRRKTLRSGWGGKLLLLRLKWGG